MKGAELPIQIIVFLILGIIVLILIAVMITGSHETTKDIANQNDLFNCCRKFLPDCTDYDVQCTDEYNIQDLAIELHVTDLPAFCGCTSVN